MKSEDMKKQIIDCEAQMAGLQRHIESLQSEWLELKHERAKLLRVVDALELVEELIES
jgi:prefoldin subunit 5